jgi:archaetidylinositol phosphate synthase
MALHQLKYSYRKVLSSFGEKIKFIHPDIISYTAFFVALIIGILYYKSGENSTFLIINIILILLRMTLNTLDGLIALKIRRTSRKGKIVNALPDRYADMFYLIGISFSSLCSLGIGMIATITVLLVSYSGMLGKAMGVSWQQQGPLDKVDRLVIVMVFSLIQFLLIKIEPSWLENFRFTTMEICMILFIILGHLTIIRRVLGMVREINKAEYGNTEKKL